MRLRVLFVFALAIVASTETAIAQNVWVVAPTAGPGVFSTQIQPAVNAAADGDLILVKGGSFVGFSITNKSVGVVAELGASVNVLGTVEITNLSSSQRVLFERVAVSATAPNTNLWIHNNAGPVWLEGCTFAPVTAGFDQYGVDGADVDQCASVAFLRCTMTGSHAYAWKGSTSAGWGLFASASNVTLYDSACVGGAGETGFTPFGGKGGIGAYVLSGFAFASGSVFQGGAGGSSAISGGMGGTGLDNNATFVSLDCTFLGGIGGSSPQGSGAPGIPLIGTVDAIAGKARHFNATSPIRELQNTTMTLGGIPGENAAILFSLGQDVPIYFPDLSGVLLPSLVGADAILLAAIPGSGVLTIQKPVPSLPPSLKGQPIYVQSFFFDAAITNVVLGPASAVVVLDSSL
jgi:hypothetical protein